MGIIIIILELIMSEALRTPSPIRRYNLVSPT